MAKLKRWGRELLLLALIALAVVTVMDWLNAPQAPPAFDAQTLTTLDGESVSLAQLSHEHLPYDFLGRVSNRIINEVDGISRVVYDISGKPPATIEWE